MNEITNYQLCVCVCVSESISFNHNIKTNRSAVDRSYGV